MTHHHNVKTMRRFRATIAVLTVVALVIWQGPFATPVHAASLSASRDHLSRNIASLTTGVDHIITFTTSSVDGTEGKVKLTFPDADDSLWCRTVGSGDLVATGNTEDSASSLPGTLTAACTQGSGASSYDTIVISGVTNLSVSTRYGVKVTDGSTSKLGTPTAGSDKVVAVATLTAASAAIDSQNIALSIISNDQIAVTATVDPTLTFALSGNTAALGTLTTGNINKASITSTVSTNAQNGFTSYVYYNNTLQIDGSHAIADESGGGTIVAGTPEFGVATNEASAVDIGLWSPAACTNTATTSNATALTTSAKSYGTAATVVSSDATILCVEATIGATTTAGAYSNTLTLVTAAKF